MLNLIAIYLQIKVEVKKMFKKSQGSVVFLNFMKILILV